MSIEAGSRMTRRSAQDSDADFGAEVAVSTPFPDRPPLLIEPASAALRSDLDAAVAWVGDHKPAIEEALLDSGAVFLRGFPVDGAADFARLMSHWNRFSAGYAGGASDRKAIEGDVMEATRTPPDIYIFLHQEMSYLPYNPRLIAFHCHVPSVTGGNTVIADMRGVLEALPDDLTRRFIEHGMVYRRHLRNADIDDWRANPAYPHPSWQYWFQTDDRDTVSADLGGRGLHFEWEDEGSLRIETRAPGVTTHPVTGDLLLFNQLYTQFQHPISYGEERVRVLTDAYGDRTDWPTSIRFGDGTLAREEDFQAVHREMQKRTVSFDWQAGDVMILENKFTAHGREPFEGERDVQVMLFE
ncbi:MAG TPA: TauD/TfdA family dioxygenase [Novosphingobium sp.]|nr:TauD/TfdA family dioxygenase [Novosphingobium sp.]